MKSRLVRLGVVPILALAAASTGSAQALPYAIFERYVEALRQEGGIPGLSAAILRNGQIEWMAGFGREDIGNALPATPDTPYPVGSMTQAVSGVLLGICVDRHLLDVDDPIKKYNTQVADPVTTVRQVLAHASDGGKFKFDPVAYASLTGVVDVCGDKPYRQFLADEVIERFGLARSVPGLDMNESSNPARLLFDAGRLGRFSDIIRRTAVPYRVDRNGRATQSAVDFKGMTAANGLVSSVYDLARFDQNLDAGIPVSAKTLNDMWTPPNFGAGVLPTGLGWFVQTTSNERLVWQAGLIPDAGSGFWLRVPSKRLTLILLANSAGAASGINFDRADITASPFVRIFLGLFL